MFFKNLINRITKKAGSKVVKNSFQKENLTKNRITDAGLDVRSSIDTVVPARGRALIDTEVFIKIPSGHVGLLWSRSGLSLKHGIQVGAGCVDESYRGEVKVVLYNFSDIDFEIKRGDRIAQLLTIPINYLPYESVDSIDKTDRGENGFESSGRI